MSVLAALQTALTKQKQGTDGFTVLELVALAKLTPTHGNVLKVRVFLKGEILARRIAAQRGMRPAIDGAMRPVPIYVPVKK